MTIGVGFSGMEGILLGSDMELTGVAKYRGIKDYQTVFALHGTIAAVYSGVEDDMRCLWEEVNRGIEKKMNSTDISVIGARSILEESLKTVITDKKSQFQMLVGIAKEGESPVALRVFRNRAAPAAAWEIIGAGDCELSRYLSGVMPYPHLTIYQAALWASHIIDVAKSFVQGVGQGIRLSAVMPNGVVHYMDGEVYSKKMAEVAAVIGGIWFDFCNVKLTQDEFKDRWKNVPERLLYERARIPLLLEPS